MTTSSRLRLRAVAATIVLSIASGSAAGCGVDVTGSEAAAPAPSGIAPDASSTLPRVELRQLDEPTVVRASEIGGPAVINLWATWCPPCRVELPAFQAVHTDLGETVRFIGVNQSEDPATARQFLDSVGITYEQLVDPDGALLVELRITGLPATVFLAADGTWTLHSGALSEEYLRELIATELGITA